MNIRYIFISALSVFIIGYMIFVYTHYIKLKGHNGKVVISKRDVLLILICFLYISILYFSIFTERVIYPIFPLIFVFIVSSVLNKKINYTAIENKDGSISTCNYKFKISDYKVSAYKWDTKNIIMIRLFCPKVKYKYTIYCNKEIYEKLCNENVVVNSSSIISSNFI